MYTEEKDKNCYSFGAPPGVCIMVLFQRDKTLVHQIFHILPSLKCWSPQDSLTIMRDRSKIPGEMCMILNPR